MGCQVLFNGDIGYEIQEGDDTHIVYLNKNTCTCRACNTPKYILVVFDMFRV